MTFIYLHYWLKKLSQKHQRLFLRLNESKSEFVIFGLPDFIITITNNPVKLFAEIIGRFFT